MIMQEKEYKKRNIKDTSKRNLSVRIEKREILLALAYTNGYFLGDDTLIIQPRSLKQQKQMLTLLDKVDWVTATPWNKINNLLAIEVVNAPNKSYLSFVKKRIKSFTKKGLQYMYSPVFLWCIYINLLRHVVYNKKNVQYIFVNMTTSSKWKEEYPEWQKCLMQIYGINADVIMPNNNLFTGYPYALVFNYANYHKLRTAIKDIL